MSLSGTKKEPTGNSKDVDVDKIIQGLASKEELDKKFDDLALKLDAGKKASEDEMRLLEFLSQKEEARSDKKPEKKVTKPLDEMSRKELIDHVSSKSDAKWEKKFKYLEDRINENETGTAMNSMKAEIRVLSNKHNKEFKESQEATFELYKKHPTLSVEQAFHLATASGTREKLAEAEKKGEPKAHPLSTLPRTSTGEIHPKALTKGLSKDMTLRDRAEAIYDRMGGVADIDDPQSELDEGDGEE